MGKPSEILIFDRSLVQRHHERAADRFSAHNILFEEAAAHLIDRLGDVKRDFQTILDLGPRDGTLPHSLARYEKACIVTVDNSGRILRQAQHSSPPFAGGVRGGGVTLGEVLNGQNQPPRLLNSPLPNPPPPTLLCSFGATEIQGRAGALAEAGREGEGIPALGAADEEFLPFAANSFDLAVSNLSLHWINDLPGVLAQIRNVLKPDGLFLAALPGGRTLHELRACLLDAEMKVTGGVSPRVSPMVELQAASALLQRAGFELPVTDQETIVLTYPDAFALMRDLRGMGETNALRNRLRRFTRRAVFMEAARLYRERYAGSDGRIPVTFEILFLHGWKTTA